MPAPVISWNTSLDRNGGEAVAAWVFSLTEAGAFATLEPTERDKQDLMGRTGLDAHRFLARRSVLRHLVAGRRNVSAETVEVGYDAEGAPLLLPPYGAMFCSVAARGDRAAVVLAEQPVGIDLEPLEPGPIPWAVLAEEERVWLLTHHDDAARCSAFIHLWTAKEAYLKARRSGLMADPSTVAVTWQPLRLRENRRSQALGPSTWHRHALDGRTILAACVVADPT